MKTALVYTNQKSQNLLKFLSDKNYKDFKILAVVSDRSDSKTSYTFSDDDIHRIKRKNMPKVLDIILPQFVNRFIYKFVDAIFILDTDNFNAVFQQLINLGTEARKIISWSEDRRIGILQSQQPDGNRLILFEGLEFHVKTQDDMKFVQEIYVMLQRQKNTINFTLKENIVWLRQIYRDAFGRELNLKNPKSLSEKIQWLKFYEPSELKTRLADKYLVREWVENKIGKKYLIPLYGVWDNFDEIDFDELPNKFVLKCNHGCGMNIIVKDKNDFDIQNAREKINAWMIIEHGQQFVEPHYNDIKHKIIAEKFMEDKESYYLRDYKFFCFNGKPLYCYFGIIETTEEESKKTFFDMNWKHQAFRRKDHLQEENPEKIKKPKTFSLMKKLAAKLSEEFTFVRVDFYEIDDKIYFGEMTFTPTGGYMTYEPNTIDDDWGNLLKLPIISPLADDTEGGGMQK